MHVIVAHYLDPLEAQIARGLLVSEGIDAAVGDDQIGIANWELRLATGGAKLRVPAEQAERAREVLRALEAGEYRLDAEGDADDAPHDAAGVPDRESVSSRVAWVSLMLLGLPLPWRRRPRSDDAERAV